MVTNSVIGTQWVEGVCSTNKQATVLAEQNLDEITAFSLQKKKQPQNNQLSEEEKNHKVQGNIKGKEFWTKAKLKTTS